MSVDLNRFADLMAILAAGEKLTRRQQKELEEIIRRLSFLVQGLSGQFDSQGNVVINNITEVLGEWFNKITVYHADFAPCQFFNISNGGLIEARGVCRIGDRMHIPASPDGNLTAFLDVPTGVKVDGAGTLNTYLGGRVQLNPNSFLRDLSVKRDFNNSDPISGVVGPGSGEAYLNTVSIAITQAGSGNAYAVDMEAGDLKVRGSYLNGTSTGGTGNGILSGAGDIYLEEGTVVLGSTAAISGTNTFSMDFNKFIRLFDITGTYDWIFTFDATGMDAANTAAAAGDAIWLPIGTLANNSITITDDVKVMGASRYATILTGQITLGDGASLENLSNIRTSDSGDDLKGVIVDGENDAAKIHNCDISATNAGAGDAYGVSVEINGASLQVWGSYLYGSSGSGSGFGGNRDSGTTANLYVFGGRAEGSTGAFSE